jgi:hypothetical protein
MYAVFKKENNASIMMLPQFFHAYPRSTVLRLYKGMSRLAPLMSRLGLRRRCPEPARRQYWPSGKNALCGEAACSAGLRWGS